MKPGIGVLAYKRSSSLRKCLDSLFDNLPAVVPVVVNFDLCSPEMEAIAREYPVTVIAGSKVGVPFANNRLMRYFEDRDAIFLVQDDVRFLRPEWLERYCEALEVVSYLAFYDAYYPQSKERPRHYHVNYRERRVLVARDGASLWACHKSPQGAFQAIGRRCIDKVGYFDEAFGRYGCEHNDYWRRTCNAGIASHEQFYDVAQSTELLKIDWTQACSLSQHEREAAYIQSEAWRRKLFESSEVGFHRTWVEPPAADIRILFSAPTRMDWDVPRPLNLPTFHLWPYPHRLPVLTYHAISHGANDRYAVSPALFERHLELLCNHFRFITAAEAAAMYMAGATFPQGVAVLSFDDGYTDLIDILPLLRDRGINATIFVPAQWVGRPNDWDSGAFVSRQHLDWNDLHGLARMGHEIGSHSSRHIRFDRLSPGAVADEIAGSRMALEDNLGFRVHTIAYPFGSISPDLATMCAGLYDAGFTTTYGNFDWTENRHMINRIVVKPTDEPHTLLGRINDYMMQAPLTEPTGWTSWPNRAPRKPRPEGSAL